MEHTLLHDNYARICDYGNSIFFHIFCRTEKLVFIRCILQIFVIFHIGKWLLCLSNHMACIFHYGKHQCNYVDNRLHVFYRKFIHRNETLGLYHILD